MLTVRRLAILRVVDGGRDCHHCVAKIGTQVDMTQEEKTFCPATKLGVSPVTVDGVRECLDRQCAANRFEAENIIAIQSQQVVFRLLTAAVPADCAATIAGDIARGDLRGRAGTQAGELWKRRWLAGEDTAVRLGSSQQAASQ